MKFSCAYNIFMAPFEKFAGLAKCRKQLIAYASGSVLEVGPGSGVNGRFYDAGKITGITLLSPEEGGAEKAEKNYGHLGVPLQYHRGDVQRLPFPSDSFDTVVATLLFCSVKDPLAGLEELCRVLKPGGRYLFIEHIRPSKAGSAAAADFFTPFWRKIAGGCHLNRETLATIEAAGFLIDHGCEYTKGVFTGGAALCRRT
jgi:ubiquinone/menaquinone biosynthesis C-methylase UbiE